jgi:ribosomal protein S18 acetylase RimI-like enzyme
MLEEHGAVINMPVADHEVSDLRHLVGWERREEDYPLLFERCVFWGGIRNEKEELIAFAYIAGTGLQHGYLEDVTVHPAYQQKGIGKVLVQALLAEATRRGSEIITCTFSQEHIGFYQKCGFTVCHGGLWRKDTK